MAEDGIRGWAGVKCSHSSCSGLPRSDEPSPPPSPSCLGDTAGADSCKYDPGTYPSAPSLRWMNHQPDGRGCSTITIPPTSSALKFTWCCAGSPWNSASTRADCRLAWGELVMSGALASLATGEVAPGVSSPDAGDSRTGDTSSAEWGFGAMAELAEAAEAVVCSSSASCTCALVCKLLVLAWLGSLASSCGLLGPCTVETIMRRLAGTSPRCGGEAGGGWLAGGGGVVDPSGMAYAGGSGLPCWCCCASTAEAGGGDKPCLAKRRAHLAGSGLALRLRGPGWSAPACPPAVRPSEASRPVLPRLGGTGMGAARAWGAPSVSSPGIGLAGWWGGLTRRWCAKMTPGLSRDVSRPSTARAKSKAPGGAGEPCATPAPSSSAAALRFTSSKAVATALAVGVDTGDSRCFGALRVCGAGGVAPGCAPGLGPCTGRVGGWARCVDAAGPVLVGTAG